MDKKREQFNPQDYKRIADMPPTVRKNFTILPDGGFVRKTAKDFFDKKSAELKMRGNVSAGEIEKMKYHFNTEDRGLGLTVGDRIKRLRNKILGTVDSSKAISKEEQHRQDVVSKIMQDEQPLFHGGNGVSRMHSDVDNMKAKVDDEAAFAGVTDAAAISAHKRDRTTEIVMDYEKARMRKTKASIPETSREKEQEILEDLNNPRKG